MLTERHWKADAIVRLVVSIIVSIYVGSLAASAFYYTASGKSGWKFWALSGSAFLLLSAALIFLHRPWQLDTFVRRIVALTVCFYTGLVLGAWAQSIAGSPAPGGSIAQTLIGTLSGQGTALLWIALFLREHHLNWDEAFGFSNRWLEALLFGFILACIFLPVGRGLQYASNAVLEHLPRLPFKPEEQQAVQTLRLAVAWQDRLALGVVTILLAPVAEELFFRGILYPAIKQAGFPRLALWGTSLLFASIHFNFLILLPLLVLALLLTLLYERTNNLLAPIVAHSLFNGLNFARLYLTQS